MIKKVFKSIVAILSIACLFTAVSCDGEKGEQGANGKSAYEIWLDLGNKGTEEDFLNSLKGQVGKQGANGKSAYEIWLDLGNVGSKEDFLNWLRGVTNDESETEGITGTYYQTELSFYISPVKDNEEPTSIYGAYSNAIMDTTTKLLESEIFSENILDSLMASGVEYVPTQKYQADGTTLTKEYSEWILLIADCTSYTRSENVNCIDVSISIQDTQEMENEKEKATIIKDQIIESIPIFIEAIMYKPDGYDGTKCTLLNILTDIQTVVYKNGQKID